jgi:hypothetical protein
MQTTPAPTFDDVRRIIQELTNTQKETERSIKAEFSLLGAVAAMVIPDDVGRYAYKQGLFVMAQNGEAMLIKNDDKFNPKTW